MRFIGFTDRAKEGTYVWVDDTALSYTNWGNNDPNDDDGNLNVIEFVGPYYDRAFGWWIDRKNTRSDNICVLNGATHNEEYAVLLGPGQIKNGSDVKEWKYVKLFD
ncbi:hypothetical protein LSH36_403g03006 [Paralvinella palmiformis]|uniref:C-type lectin domain-containing protein n=1 Tax=Paralvinella palmiformis TaxID=53620 RepID=A0AAD9JCE0_9ANNE|nr:hypothetical protein LSH36_403g03006 [Paralvinella palmiformis]